MPLKQYLPGQHGWRVRNFIANRTCNTTVTGSCRIHYYQIQSDPVICPVIGPSVLSTANQNAWVMTQ